MSAALSPPSLTRSGRTRIPSNASSSGPDTRAHRLIRRLNNGLEAVKGKSVGSPAFDQGGKPDRALEESPHGQELQPSGDGIRPGQSERDHCDDEVTDAAILPETPR